MRRVQGFMAAAAIAAALLAGCGDDDGAPAITGTPPPTTAGATTTTSTTLPGAPDATVRTVFSSLGSILADSNGRTLYIFTNDEPGTSNCTGACLNTWPRYVPTDVVAGAGLDDRVDSISVDGVRQATIDDKPLYYYAGDTEPGDINGQGVGGNWFAVRPSGDPVR